MRTMCLSGAIAVLRGFLVVSGADYTLNNGTSGGVGFTPWLHGNRCPFEDAAAAGMFFNLRLETGKAQMLRAVLEGICFHLRWMREVQE